MNSTNFNIYIYINNKLRKKERAFLQKNFLSTILSMVSIFHRFFSVEKENVIWGRCESRYPESKSNDWRRSDSGENKFLIHHLLVKNKSFFVLKVFDLAIEKIKALEAELSVVEKVNKELSNERQQALEVNWLIKLNGFFFSYKNFNSILKCN